MGDALLPRTNNAAEPDVAPKTRRTPFRILPSRARDLAPGWMLIGGCVAVAAIGLAMATGSSARDGGMGALILVGGIFGGLFGAMWLRRELRYFNPRAEYWMEIAADHFGLITPDAKDHCPWTEIRAFEVEETTRRNRYGGRTGVSYKTVARYRRYDLTIALGDFATRLGQEDKDRAEAVCAILNDLRIRALASGGDDFDAVLPAGLVIGEAKPGKAKPRPPTRSVVMRQ